jgi:hypothetical protein
VLVGIVDNAARVVYGAPLDLEFRADLTQRILSIIGVAGGGPTWASEAEQGGKMSITQISEICEEHRGKKHEALGSEGRTYSQEGLDAYKKAKTQLGLGDWLRSREIASSVLWRKP